ncbi:hypothetical protein EYF80_000365 [Liparis tanakae]|uniref:Uncharacterized protein n=1 Tax=Liparis tanakae TaxID=230148 RepID=A0A4Z2JGJ6_9TELE|nr:hypothetical protein EYF80_000365 [Liparis tanakae]
MARGGGGALAARAQAMMSWESVRGPEVRRAGGKQGGEKVGGEKGLTPPAFSNKPALCSSWRTRATQNIKYLDDQTVPSQRDNVTVANLCLDAHALASREQ